MQSSWLEPVQGRREPALGSYSQRDLWGTLGVAVSFEVKGTLFKSAVSLHPNEDHENTWSHPHFEKNKQTHNNYISLSFWGSSSLNKQKAKIIIETETKTHRQQEQHPRTKATFDAWLPRGPRARFVSGRWRRPWTRCGGVPPRRPWRRPRSGSPRRCRRASRSCRGPRASARRPPRRWASLRWRWLIWLGGVGVAKGVELGCGGVFRVKWRVFFSGTSGGDR